ncbi:MAG TPA: DUF4198 domain-containing protein [Ohtaekwangia sp.]|nr:DUF4198 domain-containing protein [Ohtaekwangia sp.]
MIKLVLLSGILAFSLGVIQNEMWLMPDKFVYTANGDTCRIKLLSGESFTGQLAEVEKKKIAGIEWVNDGKKQDITSLLNEKEKQLAFRLPHEGTYKVVLKVSDQSIGYDPETFNQLLKDYDLGEVMYARETKGETNKPGEVLQSSSHTVLIQSGTKVDQSISTSGLPVEILPDKNPYALKLGDEIKFTILYNKKPLFGARVKIWNRYNNRTTLQHIYTEKDGTITTHLSSPGPWMISVVKMDAHDQGNTQWKTYNANLVFGVQ